MGKRAPAITVLTRVEVAMIIDFDRRTLLPLDDVLGCLLDSIPKVTGSSRTMTPGPSALNRQVFSNPQRQPDRL